MKPLYSIVIATYGGKKRLPNIFDALLRQSVAPNDFEIVIVDDCTPRTSPKSYDDILAAYPKLSITVLQTPHNGGPALARNLGISTTAGSIIFFLDDDSIPPAQWMEHHISIYREHPDVMGVGGWYRTNRNDIKTNLYQLYMETRYEAGFQGNIWRSNGKSHTYRSQFPASNTANLSIRKGLFHFVGMFDERFIAPGGEDTEFSQRIRDRGFILYYSPLAVEHVKELTLRRFIKTAINRGYGNYVLRVIVRKQQIRHAFSLSNYFSYFRSRVSVLAQAYPLVKKRRLGILIMGLLFGFFSESRFMMRWYRLKYATKKRIRPTVYYPNSVNLIKKSPRGVTN